MAGGDRVCVATGVHVAGRAPRRAEIGAGKIYLRDAGLLHSLLDLPDPHSLLAHPRVGASWEGFAIEQVLQAIRPAQVYFWATHSGAELDLFFAQRGRHFGVEVKFNEAPSVTPSMRSAVTDLGLDHLWIVHAGPHSYPVSDKISALALRDMTSLPDQLGKLLV